MRHIARTLIFVGLMAIARASAAPASTPEGIEFFEKKVRPILAESCYECHSATSKKLKGGLLLDTRAGVLKGGDSGPAIVPGEPEKSLLIKAVRYTDPDLQMPPKDGKLSDAQITDLVAWVELGAPDPRAGKPETRNPKLETQKHWAFKPVSNPPPPLIRNPPVLRGSTAEGGQSAIRNPIDAFIAAPLEEQGMKPSAPADPRTLIRRVFLDLIGLPPTPEEVQAFLADRTAGAFEKVVDRLLARPQYGERWGRHWLDVA